MTSQPGAGGDAVVERARTIRAGSELTDPRGAVWDFADWIVKWSDTVTAAVRQAELKKAHHDGGCKHETLDALMQARRDTEAAVRSALTHRDEKEGG